MSRGEPVTTVPNDPQCPCGMEGMHPLTLRCGPPAEPTRTEAGEPRAYIVTSQRAEELALYLIRCRTFAPAYDLHCEAANALRQLGDAHAELLRLNGPTCPHDGERASEHNLYELYYLGCTYEQITTEGQRHECGFIESRHLEFVKDHVFKRRHPAWPEGEEWLRRNAR